mmetsp:Transcript_9554/g.14391  ORF Transcript_9554/g.14391 Transcript_9554/m.14391 type:complete len:200 (-) Transcript_9554:8-607(-)
MQFQPPKHIFQVYQTKSSTILCTVESTKRKRNEWLLFSFFIICLGFLPCWVEQSTILFDSESTWRSKVALFLSLTCWSIVGLLAAFTPRERIVIVPKKHITFEQQPSPIHTILFDHPFLLRVGGELVERVFLQKRNIRVELYAQHAYAFQVECLPEALNRSKKEDARNFFRLCLFDQTSGSVIAQWPNDAYFYQKDQKN